MAKPFDFKAARDRQQQLIDYYRRLLHIRKPEGTADWWLASRVEEIEREISAAHAGQSKTAVLADDCSETKTINIVAPFYRRWWYRARRSFV